MRAFARLGIAACSLAMVLLLPRGAHAVYQCGDQKDDCKCGADDPYPCCDNGGNCTWWAWEAACCNWAVGLPGWGNANQWVGNAQADPNYDVLSAPVVGSIACRVSGTYGHVAWVTAVNGANITVSEENCCTTCNYGLRTHDYAWSYFDGGFIVRKSQCECASGDSQSQDCGNCGKQTRGCGTDCKWGGWGSCSGEGECAKGATGEQSCGDCGTESRTCSDTCHWGSFGACSGPDPDSGTNSCDTGLKGVCAAGTKKCIAGATKCQQNVQSSAEICDKLDNNCNGQVDENNVCGSAGGAAGDGGTHKSDGAVGDGAAASGNDSGTAHFNNSSGDQGGCGCRLDSRGTSAGWALAAASIGMWFAGRRRRRASEASGRRSE